MATRLGLYGGPRKSRGASSGVASALISGVISFTETQLVDGGTVTTITLHNDTWVVVGATFDAQRQNLIDGFDSAQSEGTGWNAEIRDKEVVGAVVRTSDTRVTITWTASAAFDITAHETITCTVPSTAVTAGVEIGGTPTLFANADGVGSSGIFIIISGTMH